MSSQNNVHLMGFVTRDPRQSLTKKTQSPVTTFNLAVRRDYKDASGNRPVDFIRVVAWNRSAVYCGENLHKGDFIAVEGNIRTSRFKDANGIEREIYEIHTRDVNLLRRKTQHTDLIDPVQQDQPEPESDYDISEDIMDAELEIDPVETSLPVL